MLLCRLTAIILNTDAPAARRRDGVRCCQRRDAAQDGDPLCTTVAATQRRYRPETEGFFAGNWSSVSRPLTGQLLRPT